MVPITKKCSVVLHQLSDAAVRRGRCHKQSLTQTSPGGSKVKSEALENVDPPPVLKFSAIYIKEEPENETEEVSIKEEPFGYGNEASSAKHLPSLPCKTEAQVEAHDVQSKASHNIFAPMSNQFSEGESAPASRDAESGVDVSGASSSKPHIRLGSPQRRLVPGGAGQLQQHIHEEHPASEPNSCSKRTSSTGSGLQQLFNAMPSMEISFKFTDCEQSCTRGKSMQKHIHSKHLCRNKRQCQIGLNSCATDADLEQHILLRSPQRKAQKSSRNKHADGCKEILHKRCHSIRSSMKYTCSECDYACTKKWNLKSHFLYKHSTEKHIQCSECDYVCTTKKALKSHFLYKHSTEKPIQCSECDYACITKWDLKRHFLYKHSTEKPIQCSECDYACTTKRALKSHFLYKHSTEKPIQCSKCDYACTTKRDLKTHFLYKHSTKKPFLCSECDHACITRGDLKRHVIQKHSTEKAIKCSKCDYACTSKGDLKKHFLHKHSAEKPIQCSECDYACITKWVLKRHFLCKHSTEKLIQCSKCDYACTTKRDLKTHFLYKHSTKKPLTCSECDYACITKWDLKRHFLCKHSTEKPIMCSECDYACVTKWDLKRHFLCKHSTEEAVLRLQV